MRSEALLPTGIAARRLGLSRERVLQLCNAGALEYVRDASGRRLIPAGEVERVHLERERAARRRAQREAVAP